MFDILQVVGVILAVAAMVPALAHALELPGKLRLAKEDYMAVQPIYYPGFTVMGFSEPGAILAAIFLVFLAVPGSVDFWLTLAALAQLISMHAVYWLRTHPVTNFWLQDKKLGKAGTRFFSVGSEGENGTQGVAGADWKDLRNQWEHSHVIRAVLAVVSFIALLLACSSVTDV